MLIAAVACLRGQGLDCRQYLPLGEFCGVTKLRGELGVSGAFTQQALLKSVIRRVVVARLQRLDAHQQQAGYQHKGAGQAIPTRG